MDDRSACRQRVCGRTRRCRDDQPVGFVDAHRVAVDAGIEIDDPRLCALGDDRVVEHLAFGEHGTVALERHRERHPQVDVEVAGDDALHAREQLLGGHRREKAEAAQVDAKDRHGPLTHEPRDAQQRTVAAEDDDEVGTRDHIGLGGRGPSTDLRGALRLHEGGEPRVAQPGDELPGESNCLLAPAFDHYTDDTHGAKVSQGSRGRLLGAMAAGAISHGAVANSDCAVEKRGWTLYTGRTADQAL